jgi:hypothetical protein
VYRLRKLIFGAGIEGQKAAIEQKDEVIAFIDNDPNKLGTNFMGLPVVGIAELSNILYDRIQIASSNHTMEIFRQLTGLGIPEDRIYSPLIDRSNLDRQGNLVAKHLGSPAFIVGNGPSLTKEDLDKLAAYDCITFGFNKIFLAYDETKFRPNYYIVEDWLVAKNNRNVINSLSDSQKIIPEILLQYLSLGVRDTIVGLTYDTYDKSEIRISNDLCDLSWGATVIFTAYQIAIIMGCSPIYFIGVDWSYNFDSKTEVQILQSTGSERNHFINNYHTPGEMWNRPDFKRMNRAMEVAAAHAISNNLKVFNATRGGELKYFQRVNFDELTRLHLENK